MNVPECVGEDPMAARPKGKKNTHNVSNTGSSVKTSGKVILWNEGLTEGIVFIAFERWRQTQILSSSPGACGWTATMNSDDWKGPRRIASISDWGKGPDILPTVTSLVKYSLMGWGWSKNDGWLGMMWVDESLGIRSLSGKPCWRLDIKLEYAPRRLYFCRKASKALML